MTNNSDYRNLFNANACLSISSPGRSAMMEYGDKIGDAGMAFANAVPKTFGGGTAEALGGGKPVRPGWGGFANGAVNGAYVMMFNHLLEQNIPDKEVTELDYPPAVDFRDENWDEQLAEWIIFMEENDLKDIPITKIINFESTRLAGRQRHGQKYYGTKKVADGYVTWSTNGPDPNSPDRRLVADVTAAAIDVGNGSYTGWSFILEGYPNYGGGAAPTNLFQIEFSNFRSFSNYYKNVYPNHEKIRFIEYR